MPRRRTGLAIPSRRRSSRDGHNPSLVWSASKIITAVNCPLQGFFEHFLKRRGPTPSYTALGSALHYMFQRFFSFTSKKRSRFFYLEEKTLLKTWQGWWWGALFPDREPKPDQRRPVPHGFGGYQEPPEIVPWRNDDIAGKSFARGVNILKRFFARYDPWRHVKGNSYQVEVRFSFWYKGILYPGRIDRVDITPDGVIIVDYKTKQFSPAIAATGVQATMYQFAYEHYLRSKLLGQPPLIGIQIYDYSNDGIQDLPLRDQYEIDTMLRVTQEGAIYYDGVLNGGQLPLVDQRTFHVFDRRHIELGTIRPLALRDDRCKYCQFLDACRKVERGDGTEVSRMWRSYQQQKAKGMPSRDIRLPILDDESAMQTGEVYVVPPELRAEQGSLSLTQEG